MPFASIWFKEQTLGQVLPVKKNLRFHYKIACVVVAMEAERIRKVLAEKTRDDSSDVWEAPGEDELNFVCEGGSGE